MSSQDPMQGVFINTDEWGHETTSYLCPVQTNKFTEDMNSKPRVFGPQQLNSSTQCLFNTSVATVGDIPETTINGNSKPRVFGPQPLNTSMEGTITDHLVISDKTKETAVNLVGTKRPRRSAAIQATNTIKQVLQWERCSESSTLFKNVDHEINQEFDRFTSPGCGGKKSAGNLVASVCDGNNISMGPSMNSTFTQPKEADHVSDIASDDECHAFKSDVEGDDDDDCEDSDDDVGSLASFVVDDDYISDEDETEKHCKKTKYESQSVSGSESGGGSSDDEDESVHYDDDTDTDVSDESESADDTELVSHVANGIVPAVGSDVINVETGEDVGGDVVGGVGGDVGRDISTNNDVDMPESHDLMHESMQDPVWVPFEPDNSIWFPEEPIQVGFGVADDESPINTDDFFM